MKGFFEGSNLFAFVSLLLALLSGVAGYFMPDLTTQSTEAWQTLAYALAAVFAILGLGVYAYNVIAPGSAGQSTVNR